MPFVAFYLQQQLTCDDDTTLLLQDCYLLEERERLQEEWRLFREQKKNFEKERKSFTEAAIRLGLEVLGKGALVEDELQVFLLYVTKCSHPAISVSDVYRERLLPYCKKHIFSCSGRSLSWQLKKPRFLCILENTVSATGTKPFLFQVLKYLKCFQNLLTKSLGYL